MNSSTYLDQAVLREVELRLGVKKMRRTFSENEIRETKEKGGLRFDSLNSMTEEPAIQQKQNNINLRHIVSVPVILFYVPRPPERVLDPCRKDAVIGLCKRACAKDMNVLPHIHIYHHDTLIIIKLMQEKPSDLQIAPEKKPWSTSRMRLSACMINAFVERIGHKLYDEFDEFNEQDSELYESTSSQRMRLLESSVCQKNYIKTE